MKRTTAPNNQSNLYVDEIPGSVLGTSLIAEDRNLIQEELVNTVLGGEIALSGADDEQVIKAIANLAAKGDFYVEAGGSAADVYVLERTGDQKQITLLKDGMRIRFRVTNTNTGASTVTTGIAVKDIKVGTNALLAGMLTAGDIVEIVFDESNDNFQLINTSWASYTPTYGADGTMTFTSVVTNAARFRIKNGDIEIHVDATGTTGGTATRYVTFTPPINATKVQETGSGQVQPGVGRFGAIVFAASVSNIFVGNADNSNWGLGASRNFSANISYKI